MNIVGSILKIYLDYLFPATSRIELNKSKIPQAETDDTLLSIDFNKLDSKIATIIITI